jgi:hypothetical protein
LVGVLSGGVLVGSVAGTINNIGGCIILGIIAGAISGFWLKYVHPRINANHTYDHMGIIGPVTINAFLSIFMVAPILYGSYSKAEYIPSTFSAKIVNERSSTFELAVTGITLAIGLALGLVTGIICYLTRDPADDFNYAKVTS